MLKNDVLKYLCSILLLSSLPAYSGESISESKDLDNLSLEELLDIKVSTVSKYLQNATDAPASIIVITEEQIKSRGYLDIKDIFFDLPGFDVSGNAAGEVRTLVMPRGLTGDNKVLVLQDGQRLNSPTGERFLFGNNIPLSNVKRVEVIYGPASAMYGADAFGAIVNIITKSGEEVDGVSVNLNYGNLNTLSPSISIGKKINDLDFMLSGRFFKSDGQNFASDYKELKPILSYQKNGFTYQQPISSYDIYGKLKFQEFSLLFDFNNTSEPNGESEIPNNYMYIKDNVWAQRLNRVIAEYRKSLFEGKVETTTTLSNYIYEVLPETNFNIAQERDKDNIPTKAKPEYKYAYSATQKIEQQVTFLPLENLTFIGGASFENLLSFPKTQNLKDGKFDTSNLVDDMTKFIDPNNKKVFGTIDQTAFGVRPYQNYAAYLQGEYLPISQLRLVAGGRYDYNTLFFGTFNPRMGAVYKPIEPLTLKLHYGTAYIQPSNYYRWENWANPFAMHVPNLDLKPEKVGSITFSSNYKINKNISLGLELFRNDVVDIIKPVPIDQNKVYNPFLIIPQKDAFAETNKNFGKQYTQGAEVKFDYLISENKLFDLVDFKALGYAYYSFLMGEDIAEDANSKNTEIAKISNHKVSFGVDFDIWKFKISPRFRWVSPISTLPFNSEFKGQKFDGYFVANLNTRFEIFKNLSAYVTVNNLLDTPYYAAAPFGESVWILPRSPQAKRTILFGLNYDFNGNLVNN